MQTDSLVIFKNIDLAKGALINFSSQAGEMINITEMYVNTDKARVFYRGAEQVSKHFLKGMRFKNITGMFFIKDKKTLKILRSRLIT